MGNDFKQISKDSFFTVVEQIAQMPMAVAKNAIDDIAHWKGDGFAKKILDHLSPVKIAAMLRQHDFSCPSIISWILSSKVIVDILKIDPLFWKNIYDENRSENFFKIQNDALDLITSILVNAENRGRQGEILQCIGRDSLSRLYLFLPFIGWQIKKEQTLFIEDPDIEFGTADHLYEMIRWSAPQVAEQIIDFLYSTQIPLLYYITDLWSEAFDHFNPEPDYYSIEALMFVPVEANHGNAE